MKKIFLFILILYKGITFSSYHIKQNNNLNNTDILELNGDYSNYSLLNSKKIFDADGNFTLNNLYNLCKLYQDNIVIFLIIFLSLLLILIIQINLQKQLKKCEQKAKKINPLSKRQDIILSYAEYVQNKH